MASEWKSYTVQELIDLGMLEEPMDGNHGGIHPKTSDYVDAGVPFIMANNLVQGRVDYKGCAFITEKQAKTLRKGFAHPGDVLLTHKATIGRTAIVTDEYETIILTPQVTYYRVKSGISNRYLKYYFDSAPFQKLFSNWAGSGSTRAYLGITAQRKLPIILPPYDIQKKIADCCGVIDDKIAVNERINDNLQQQVSALFDSWFVSYDRTNGEIPADWTEGTLGDIASITSGKRPLMKQATAAEGVQIPLVGAASIMGFTNAVLYNEPILVTGRVGTHGVVQRFQTSCWTSDNTLVIKSAFYEFTYQVLQRVDYVNMNRGSTQPLITQTDLKNVSITLPTEAVLLEFEELAGSLMAMYEANRKENDRLAALRDTLLPRLMSGEIDVSDIEI